MLASMAGCGDGREALQQGSGEQTELSGEEVGRQSSQPEGQEGDTDRDISSGNRETEGEKQNLTEEELEAFTAFLGRIENNGFLLSQYAQPGEVNLNEVLYNGAEIETEPLSEAERKAYEAAGYAIETDIVRLTTRQIEDFLRRKMGIGFGDVIGELDGVYLEGHDCYVFQHGDTNYCPFVCSEGRRTEAGVYEIHCVNDNDYVSDCVVTLKETEGEYLFVSNLFVDKGYHMEDRQPESEENTPPQGQEGASSADRLTGLSRPDGDVERQLEIFAREKDQWIYEDYDPFMFEYAVYDLDGDGRLELLTQVNAGTGRFSENHFYRVDDSGDDIEELAQEYYAEYAELDLGISGWDMLAFRDDESSVTYYLASDVTKNGYAEGDCWDGAFYLKDGCVYSMVYRNRYWLMDGDDINETYYDVAGNEISKEAWEGLYEAFCAGKTEVPYGISWIDTYPEDARAASVEEITQQMMQSLQENPD